MFSILSEQHNYTVVKLVSLPRFLPQAVCNEARVKAGTPTQDAQC